MFACAGRGLLQPLWQLTTVHRVQLATSWHRPAPQCTPGKDKHYSQSVVDTLQDVGHSQWSIIINILSGIFFFDSKCSGYIGKPLPVKRLALPSSMSHHMTQASQSADESCATQPKCSNSKLNVFYFIVKYGNVYYYRKSNTQERPHILVTTSVVSC